MDELQIEQCLQVIETTFEQEAEFIVRGEITKIGELAQVKAEQLGDLYQAIEQGGLRGQSDVLIDRVKQLQSTAAEHDRHLRAMRHGLSRVLERLNRLQSDSNVGSYNQYGDRVQFSGARGSFESKA